MSKFCVQCGTQMEESAIFCPNCGFKIAPPVFVQPQQPIQQPPIPETPYVPPISNTPSEQPIQPNQPSPQYQQYQQYTQPQFTQTPPPKKSKKGLIITIVAILLLAAIGIASFFILPDLLNKDSDEDDDEKTEETKRGDDDDEESTSPDDDKDNDKDDEDNDKDTDESDNDKTPESKPDSDTKAEEPETEKPETDAITETPAPTPPAYEEYFGYDTSAEPNNIAVKPKHVYWESDGTLVAVCYVINGFDYSVTNINLKELALSTSQGTFCSGNFGVLQDLILAPYTYAEWTFRFSQGAVLIPFADLSIPVSPYWNIEYRY